MGCRWCTGKLTWSMANNAKAPILDAPHDNFTPFQKHYETSHEPITNQTMTGPEVGSSLHLGTASRTPSESNKTRPSSTLISRDKPYKLFLSKGMYFVGLGYPPSQFLPHFRWSWESLVRSSAAKTSMTFHLIHPLALKHRWKLSHWIMETDVK